MKPGIDYFAVSLVLGTSVVTTGCALSSSDDLPSSSERTGTVESAIVNGTASTAVQDAAVRVELPEWSCTGTLIAPNLVLTARHCVAKGSDDAPCTGYGPTLAASSVKVIVGALAKADGPAVAVGSKITVPQTANRCSFDLALVELDRAITGTPISDPRFTPLVAREPALAVGYGLDGNSKETAVRMQRAASVLAVGPAKSQYKPRFSSSFVVDLPDGDVLTGESTCSGDSGGPLFDAQGHVVGVSSRGFGCADAPQLFAGVRFHERLIREAMTAAAQSLGAKTTRAAALGPDAGAGAAAGPSKPGADGTAKPPRREVVEVASAGCSAAGRPASTLSWPAVTWLIAALAALAVRRAASRQETEEECG